MDSNTLDMLCHLMYNARRIHFLYAIVVKDLVVEFLQWSLKLVAVITVTSQEQGTLLTLKYLSLQHFSSFSQVVTQEVRTISYVIKIMQQESV